MKLVISFFILLVFFLSVLLFHDNEPKEKVQENSSQMSSVQLKHIQNGITEWSASISNASFGSDNSEALLSDVHFFFDSQGILIDADEGTYDINKNELTLKGNVTASSDKIVMYIDSISWLSERRDLISDSPVLIKGNGFSVQGRGLHINNNGDIRIKEDTKAIITF